VTDRPRLHVSAAQLRPLLPLLAGLLVAVATWLAWTGFQQSRDAQRSGALGQARDQVVQGTSRALLAQADSMQKGLAAPEVQAALASGDLDGAATQLKAVLQRADSVEFLPTDLDAAYAALPEGSFGRLAVSEAALAEGGAVSRIVKDDGIHLAVAAPVLAGERLVAVAYARLPLALATTALQAAELGGGTYLALRQGNFTLAERGNVALVDSAEYLSAPIEGTGLRVAAAVPEETEGASAWARWRRSSRGRAGAGGDRGVVRMAAQARRGRRRRGGAQRTHHGRSAGAGIRTGCARRWRQHRGEPDGRRDRGSGRHGRRPAGGSGHLPRVRHPRRARQDPGCRRRRTDRPRDRLADAGTGRQRHRRRPRWPPFGPGPGRRPHRGPAQGRAQCHRHRHGADAGGVFRHLPPAHRLRRRRHRQPQSAGLQRLQDHGRRQDPVRRGDHRLVRTHRPGSTAPGRKPRHPRPARRQRRLHRAHRLRRAGRPPDQGRRGRGQRRRRRTRSARAAGDRRAGGAAVLRDRRYLPQPPSRPERAAQPRGPDRTRAGGGCRGRHRLRRRRRPPWRGHARRPHRLPRPAADAVRGRRAGAQPGRGDRLRRQVQWPPSSTSCATAAAH